MVISKHINEAKVEAEQFAGKVWEKVTGYLLTAFGLVAGLAWNDAIKAIIQSIWPLETDGIKAQLVYAVSMTFLVVLVASLFVKLSKKNEKDAANE
ncbi:hypothetical protein COY25_02860 [Candidatus Uhrbacteria bacterium CG_4_10_14_0_2_um_filter_41_7]|uniref:Uncharacterized protein n=1 Tax=Candidatus Uhrbacteria bacterium CG_4_9_14_3_um_filter_41_35 TaxID=1975034 RepID=A0A2M7XFB9_9BACT|nr:MAG: hypothetical protein COV92_01170 [Candidatus Uhrbacteria bacterium CG11_big_fil_rev_8_21_14_0_20_41_9]PIZ53884.1 MAG: hypothetical protein COY25_02860 [Candidatus Uhrbacteria bacterium CG_4_10_14_0_2_um_filter_41_7]PJA46561.1 MAG: hypothetical protein CO173_02225 [Candidatus Uhrbacteria bacterium CG_4_9_14_3_um_filter_41_35]